MEVQEEEIKEAFGRMRPVCVLLTKHHSRENVRSLSAAIVGTRPEILQELQDYILFPLRIILKQSAHRSVELHTEVLRCINTVLSQTNIYRWETFQDVFNQLCLSISSPANHGQVLPLSEECKLEVVQCLRVLLNRATLGVLQSAYTEVFLPALGHAVSLLLNMAELEQLRQLRIESMLCVLDLSQINRKVCHKFLVQIGGLFASFLPGISMSLCKVITGDTKQGQAVTKTAVDVWGRVVSLVMGDCYLNTKDPIETDASSSKDKYQSLLVKRNEEWICGTSGKLKVLVKSIASITNHPSWKVRLSLVGWAQTLLTNCSRSMKDSIPIILDVLVSLVGDDYSNVAARSLETLQEFKAAEHTENSRLLTQLLEDNLHALATSLPRLMRSADDDKKVATLTLFVGYVKLMGPDVNRLLLSASHLKRVSLALMQVMELDCSQIRIIQEKATGPVLPDAEGLQTPLRPKKHFKHFVDDKIHTLLITICRTLGYYGDLELLVDHFLDLWSQSSLHTKQATMCLNEIVLGAIGEGIEQTTGGEVKCKEPCDLESLIRMLVEEYISPANWNLVTTNQVDETNPGNRAPDWQVVRKSSQRHSVELLGGNVLQICLLLEGIGNFAKVLKVQFRNMLMDVLYPVLEKVGDDGAAVISHTAYLTLLDVATACQYQGVEDLLCCNADYLVNSLSLRMRHLSRNLRAPVVLQVMLTHSGVNILPLVDDTIHEVLEALDQCYDDRGCQFMKILRALVQAIHKWYPPTELSIESKNTNPSEAQRREGNGQSPCSLRDYFHEYQRQKEIAEGNVNDLDLEENPPSVEDHGNDDDVTDDPDVKKEPLRHIKYVMQVLERCVHLMSSPDPRLRLLVLRTVAEASVVMRQDRDNYLPLVHKLWPPFVARFQDEENLVVVQAFQTLVVMAISSGDFIHRRVVKDILPKLTSVLEKQGKISVNCGSSYKFTTGFKMQLAILEGIGLLCREVDLGDHKLGLLVQACLPYLSKHQPAQLQKEVVDAFKEFILLDADCVWLYLVDVFCPKAYIPPHPCLKPIKVAGSDKHNEFSENIQFLLEQTRLNF